MRILWLKTELLHPVDKGGKIRTYNMLKELKREHEITYLSLDDGSADGNAQDKFSEYCDNLKVIPIHQRKKFTAGFYLELALNLGSRLPYAIQKYYSSEMAHEIGVRSQSGDYDVIVCDFLAAAVNLPSMLSCPVVLFEHNVEAEIWRRHYEVQSNPLKKAYLLLQWRKMIAFERMTCQRCDSIIAVSRDDQKIIRRMYGVVKVEDIPTGVDTDFFRPLGAVVVQKNSLVFTGSMDWLPNEDAIRYFLERIMPLIKRQLPDVTLTVVGRNPSSDLLNLGKRDSSVVVTGRVDDVRPYMERAAAYIVPIRIGGGTRLKIYEAMAMERPVISTTVGAEGLPLRDGVEFLSADTPQQFANAVVRVLRDEVFSNQLAQAAAMKVREQFSWNKVARRFSVICEEAAGPSERGSAQTVQARAATDSKVTPDRLTVKPQAKNTHRTLSK